MIEKILNDIKVEIESIKEIESEYLISKGTHNGFEKLVPKVAQSIIDRYDETFDIHLNVHYGHHFPDIDIIIDNIKYGIEIKFRKNGSWKTNGNSVFESITDENYENIYLLFGSKTPNKQQIRVKFAPYWQATSQIKVTHSPRFTIDMNDLNDSVFESEADYDVLRTMDDQAKISFIQDYLSKNTEGAKWYVSDQAEIKAIPFNNLTKEIQKQIIAEVLILYPDDLLIGSRYTKYDRSAQYMLDEYFTFNKSLRDMFTASGQIKINGTSFPRIIKTFIDNNSLITSIINEASDDFKKDSIDGWIDRKLLTSHEDNLLLSFKLVLDNILLQDQELLDKVNETGYKNLSSLIFE